MRAFQAADSFSMKLDLSTGRISTRRTTASIPRQQIKIAKTVISVTATMGTGASAPIGKGGNNGSPNEPYCGDIFFDTVKAASAGAYYPALAADGTYPYEGLTLAISGNTWTLTPTN